METLLTKEILAIVGPAGFLAIGLAFFLNKRINKNGEKIKLQVEKDEKHADILAKHDTAIQVLQNDMGYLKKQSDGLDKKIDKILDKI